MASLKAQLKAARRRSAHGSWFVPNGAIRAILNREAVSSQLSDCNIPIEVYDEVLELVLKECTNLFAILVRIEQEPRIVDFISQELRDYKLPLSLDAIEGLNLDAKFVKKQWEYIAPIFKRRNVLLKLKDDHVLPFLEDHKMSANEGGYANAYRITLDASHQELVNSGLDNKVRRFCYLPHYCTYLRTHRISLFSGRN
jgi:hypothetical protein